MPDRLRLIPLAIVLLLTLAAVPAGQGASLAPFGTLAGSSTPGLGGKFTGTFGSAQLVYQDSGATAGSVDSTEAIFLDLDGGTDVDQNEVQVSSTGPISAGGQVTSAITTSIATNSNPGGALNGLLRFKDSLPAYADGGPDGRFNPGETLFLDLDNDGFLSNNDLVLSGGSPGARQSGADPDTVWHAGGTECVYQGTGSTVAVGMIRVAGCTAGTAGTAVESGDADVGFALTSTTGWLMTTPAASRTVNDGVTTATSTTVTSATAAFTACDVGVPISGGSIPGGATIQVINSGTSVTLSAAATTTAATVSLTITPTGIRTLPGGVTTLSSTTVSTAAPAFCASDVGRTISGTGIPAGATIVDFVSSTSVVISSAATANGAGLTLTLGSNTALFQAGQTSYAGSGSAVASGMYRGAAFNALTADTVVDCVVGASHAADADCGTAVTTVSSTQVARQAPSYPSLAFPAIKWLDMNGDASFASGDRVYADVDANGYVGPADVRLNTGSSATFGSRPALGDLDSRAALLAGTFNSAAPIFQDTDGDNVVDATEPVALSLDGDAHLDFGDVPLVSAASCTAGTPRTGTSACGSSGSGTWKAVAVPVMTWCFHDEGTAGATRGDGLYVHLGASCTTAGANDLRVTQSAIGGTSYPGGARVPSTGSDFGTTLTAVTLGTTFTIRLYDADGSTTATSLDWPYLEAGSGNSLAGVNDARLHNQASLAFGGYLSETVATDKDTLVQFTALGGTGIPAFGFMDQDGNGGASVEDPVYLRQPGTTCPTVLASTDLRLAAGNLASVTPGGSVGSSSSEAGRTCTDLPSARFAFLPTSSPLSSASTVILDLAGDNVMGERDVIIAGTSPGSKVTSSTSGVNGAVTPIVLNAALTPRAGAANVRHSDSNGNAVVEAGEPIVLDTDGDGVFSTGDVVLGGTGVATPPVATTTSTSVSQSSSASTTATTSSSASSTTSGSSTSGTSTSGTGSDSQTSGEPSQPSEASMNRDLRDSLDVDREDGDNVLTWDDVGADFYQVWGSESPYALEDELPGSQTSYRDEGAAAGKDYVVTACIGSCSLTADDVNDGDVPGYDGVPKGEDASRPKGFIPGPSPALLVLALVGLAVLAARRRLM